MKFDDSQIAELSKCISAGINERYIENGEQNINMLDRLKIDKYILQQLLQYLLDNNCNILKYIDLSEVSFSGIDVKNKNLEGTNADINPQLVYEKCFNGTNVKGLDMRNKDFDGVDVRGANLEDTNAEIDIQSIYVFFCSCDISGTKLKGCTLYGSLEDAISDEETDLTDVTFITKEEAFEKEKQKIKALFK